MASWSERRPYKWTAQYCRRSFMFFNPGELDVLSQTVHTVPTGECCVVFRGISRTCARMHTHAHRHVCVFCCVVFRGISCTCTHTCAHTLTHTYTRAYVLEDCFHKTWSWIIGHLLLHECILKLFREQLVSFFDVYFKSIHNNSRRDICIFRRC